MDLRQLLYFQTIVEEGNISKAAKKLHICQPPLSSSMKDLEEELGVTLFIRGARHIELTDAGKVFLKRAEEMLALEKASLKEIEEIAKGVSGTLFLGCVSSNHMFLLENGIVPFSKLYPQVHYEIHEGNTYELLDLLEKNMIELAIVRTPFNHEKFDFITLTTQPMIAVYSSSLSLTLPQEIHLQDLKNLPIIMYRRFENIFSNILEKENTELTYFAKTDDARTALLWAEEGLGIALVPAYALFYPHSSSLLSSTLKEKELLTQITIAKRKNAVLSKTASALQNILTGK